jgi:GNAT superfamily N-acetyltransferase
MIEVREVDPADEAGFSGWYAALRDGAVAGRDAPLVSPYGALAASLRSPGPSLRRIPVAAVSGGETVGALLFELPLVEDLSTAMIEVDVPPAWRGRGVGSALWEWASLRAAAEERTVLQSEIHVPVGHTVGSWPGSRFAGRLGFVSRHVEDHLVLRLPAAVPEAAVPEGYGVVGWVGACPESLVASYAAMRTVMAQDVPVGELTREAARWDVARVRTVEARLARSYVSLVSLVSAAGEPAGYTELLVSLDDPDNVIQDDTFVARARRGRRLAAVLKAANLRALAEYGGKPAWVHTWTGADNAAMRAVNDAFGFTVVERTHNYERAR